MVARQPLVSTAPRRRGGGRAPDKCEKSDRATVLRKPEDPASKANGCQRLAETACKLLMDCYAAAVTSDGTGS